MAHKANKLNIVTWNANSVTGKIFELEAFLGARDVDVLAMSETKLLKTDKFYINGYSVIRKDRESNTRGGGVAILVKRGIPYARVRLPDTEFEAAAIKLTHNNIIIIAMYNRPANKYKISSLLKIYNTANNIIIAGDLNSKHKDWGNESNNVNGNTLKRFVAKNNIELNHPPTHTHYPANQTNPSTIDLFLIKNIKNYTKAETLTALSSDHNPVKIQIDNVPRENTTKTIISYQNTNWKKFRETLDTKIHINNNITDTNQLELEVTKYTKAIEKARDEHSKTIKIDTQKIQLPDDILNTIKDRNKARKTYQRTGHHGHKTQMQMLNREIKNKIAEFKSNKWHETLMKAKTNDNSIWKLAKTFSKRKQTIPPLIANGTEAITDEQKAEALAEHFYNVHKIDDTNATQEQTNIKNKVNKLIHTISESDEHYFATNLTNPKELHGIIKKLPNSKSPGEDRICNKIIKNLSKKATVQLSYIINAIIKLNYFPESYKTALVIRVLKPNKRRDRTESYRPISLLNTISKIAEKDSGHAKNRKKMPIWFQKGPQHHPTSVQDSKRHTDKLQ
jgi:hypothetical protein